MSLHASAAIFDLDGTLINSLDDLADAVNAALAAFSLPTHPVEPYKYFVGDGMETLVRRAAPAGTPEDTLAAVYLRAKEEYGKNWAAKTRPYDGIMPMLERLAAMAVPVAVLSNKPHEFTGSVTRLFFPATRFTAVQGCPAGGKPKPDPAGAFAVAERMGIAPEHIAFIGDSRTDMDTAVNAGMLPVGVLWGFRPESELLKHGAKALLARPSDLFYAVRFTAGT